MADAVALVAKMSVQLTDLEKGLRKAGVLADNSVRSIEKRFAKMNPKINLGSLFSGLKGFGLAGGAGIAAALGGSAIIDAADAWTQLTNRLKGAGVASSDLARQQQTVVDIALASRSSLDSTASLYSKLIGITQTLGVSQGEAATATQAITQALSISGTSAEAARGSIEQLGQALGSGVLRGDEFNSVMEALGTSNPIIKAIADEFGVATNELRGLAEKGELVADRVFGAIIKAAPEIAKSFEQSIPTVSQAFTNLESAATAALGKLNEGIGITNGLAAAMGAVTTAINGATAALSNFNAKRAAEAAEQPFAVPQGFSSEEEMRRSGLNPADMREQNAQLARLRRDRTKALQLQRALDPRNELGGSESAASRRGGNVIPLPPVPPDDIEYDRLNPPKGKGGRKGGGGAKSDDFKRATERIKERTSALEADTKAVGLSTFEATKLKAVQSLMNDAMEGGKKVTDAQRAQIDQLATAYANATVSLDEAEKAQERLQQAFEDVRSVADAGLGSFVSDLLDGKSAAEALQDSLKNMLNTIAQIAEKNLIEGLFGSSGSGGGGGILSGILGSFLGGGKVPKLAGGGTANAGRAHIVGENGPELFVPGRTGTVIPNGALGGGGGNVSVIVNAPPGSKVQQRQERGPDFRKIVVDVINEHASSGGLDGPMRGRYGARPAKVR